MKRFAAALLTILILANGPIAAQQAMGEAPPPAIADKVSRATAAAEEGGLGPFKAEMVSDPSLPTHTIYRPRDIAAATRNRRLPIVAWGNGACTNFGNRFRYFLTELASHGYLVVAIGPIGPHDLEWKINLATNSAVPPEKRMPGSYAAQLTDAIDWAIAQNSRKHSPYFGRLDTHAVAVMGQSCGGLQAIAAAADPRVKTAMILNSGTFPAGTPPLAGTGDATKLSLRRLHSPTAWISGDATDIAHKNAQADFAAVHGVLAVWAWHEGTGHAEHYRQAHGGEFTPVVVDWLDWQLKNDTRKAKEFIGADCGLCSQPGWHVTYKPH